METLIIDGGKGTLDLRRDGILYLFWQPGVGLEEADIQAAMALVNDVCHGRGRPLLVEMTGVKTVSHAGRAAFSNPSAASRIALLGSNPVDRVLADFRGPNTHPCPTRFFTDKCEAVDWLLQDAAGAR
ncbi:STAS/SEC14 domain-containing protein [Pseudarthrobacter sp. NamE2]|nr:STAS/SEC14 domain-containing protein [Pseudarthrobacter sp. NamE2]